MTTQTTTIPRVDRAIVDVGDTAIWVEQAGQGPDVLLIAGLGDPVEAWQAQLDGLRHDYHLIAFDNRGAGRTSLPDTPLTVGRFADDAAAVLDELADGPAHVAGFSGGSVIAQELALRRPDLVRSLVLCSTWARSDRYSRAMLDSWRWIAEMAPNPRAFLEAFFVWIYTARAHEDGLVDQIISESLAFEHAASLEAIQRSIDAFVAHDSLDRLPDVKVPTLVVAGGQDICTPPRLGRIVADAIPGARFHLFADEAHQPFQERPDEFNLVVDSFWRDSDA